MYLALRLKMTLAECLAKVSYNEYLAWQAYFQLEMDEPSRTDWYLMRVAQEVRSQTHALCNSNAAVPGIESFKVPFEVKRPRKAPAAQTKKQVSDILKKRWMAIVGGVKHGKRS